MKIHLIIGARPNIMKIAPLYKLLKKNKYFKVKLISTGQHYTKNFFFRVLKNFNIHKIDHNLNIKKKLDDINQICSVSLKYTEYLKKTKPDVVVVAGDVNSTTGCALAARFLNIKCAHIESGLRSNDLNMPEENNRIITDSISDYLFFSSQEDAKNIGNKINKKLFFIGNLMIDSLKDNLLKIDEQNIIEKLNLKDKKYIVVTLHRPSNIDNKIQLTKIINKIICFSKKYTILFFIHPRLKKNLINFSFKKNFSNNKNIRMLSPLDYLNFMKLIKESFCVITDSGGIQEETTYLKKPCLTLRENTERPITIKIGTNTLVNIVNIKYFLKKIDSGLYKTGKIPARWDGKSAERMLNILKKIN